MTKYKEQFLSPNYMQVRTFERSVIFIRIYLKHKNHFKKNKWREEKIIESMCPRIRDYVWNWDYYEQYTMSSLPMPVPIHKCLGTGIKIRKYFNMVLIEINWIKFRILVCLHFIALSTKKWLNRFADYIGGISRK